MVKGKIDHRDALGQSNGSAYGARPFVLRTRTIWPKFRKWDSVIIISMPDMHACFSAKL